MTTPSLPPPDDDRCSDEATGLPPLEVVDTDDALIVTSWSASEGMVQVAGGEIVAVRYLHVRGVCEVDGTLEWGQLHIAVPVEHAVDVAASLAMGSPDGIS